MEKMTIMSSFFFLKNAAKNDQIEKHALGLTNAFSDRIIKQYPNQ